MTEQETTYQIRTDAPVSPEVIAKMLYDTYNDRRDPRAMHVKV